MIKIPQFFHRKRRILVAAVGILLVAFAPLPYSNPAPRTLSVPIQAERFAFSPGVIEVNQGDLVVIEFSSTDVVHGLYLEDYDLTVTSDPGQTSIMQFTAEKSGTFRFRCSVTCGDLHPFMIGKLRVGNNELAWRASGAVLLVGVIGLWSLKND